MNLYRYEFEDGEGIIRGSNKLVDTEDEDDKISDVIGVFDKDLPVPDFDIWWMLQDKHIKTKSYFTEYGNQKFHEPIQYLLDFAKSKGIKINCFSFSDNVLIQNEIIYRDMFQVVYKVLD